MDFTGAARQVWTIARQSLLQARRMKVAVILAVFMLVLIPSLPFLLQSDNTHEGQLRMVITYCVFLLTLLLGILTLFLSTMTLNTEIKNQHIFLLDPKPMSRGTLLLGKWCGVMLINLVLLAIMLGATYGFVKYLGRMKSGESPQGYNLVQSEVLSARQLARPPLPDLDAWVKKEVKNIVDTGQVPEGKSVQWVEKEVRERVSKAAWVVPPGGVMKWTIKGLPTNADSLVIRFRQYANGDSSELLLPGKFIVNEGGQPYSWIEDAWLAGKEHSFGVKGNLVKPDGTLTITYMNEYARPNENAPFEVRAAFPFDDGIQVLYPAATFGENFIRSGVVIFMWLGFIAIVGIWASTFLSFPVAVLLSMVVFLIGYGADFISGNLIGQMYIFGTSMQPPWAPMNELDMALRNILHCFFMIFPNFSQFDVVPRLSEGMLISLASIFDCFFWLILVRGGILALTAWYIFRRRELAAVTVAS